MGYYLSVQAVYGLAWNDAPSACYPEDADGEPIENGEPVTPGSPLVWGAYGNRLGNPGRYLAVAEARADSVGWYAMRIDEYHEAVTDRWRAEILGYCDEIGVEPPHEPGWLALADWG